ncbi:MAG: LysR family transcriptional regulator [Steroidobacteraceae bacterium]
MNKLQAITVFVRIVDTGGMGRAAEALGLARPAVTTLIQRLETSLGVRLLNRSTRRVSVTPEGAAYYERCLAILEDLREADDSISSGHAAPRGRLRIDVPTLIARSVLVPALPQFFARYPEIDLALATRERRADLIEEGIDCALWSGEVAESNVVARRVGFLYFATCAAPVYLATHGRPTHPRELVQHRCINRFAAGSGHVAEWLYRRGSERFALRLPGDLALEDENSYVAAAQAGVGIAQIPAFVLKEAMERGTLELLLGDWFPEPAPLQLVYPQHRHVSGKLRVFVDWVATLLAEHDGIQLRSTLPPLSSRQT